jgi:hypothetical protein
VAVVGVHLLLTLGLVEAPIRPFRWLANVVGGLLFGVGMILAGGCSGSTWYRVGEGAVGAWVILIGFALGATTANVGALARVREWLQASELRPGGAVPTLPSLLGLPAWPVVAVLAVVGAVWLARGPREGEHGKWPWPLTGVAVGLLIAAGWWSSTLGGRPVGITFAVNTGHMLTYPLVSYPNQVTWSMVLLIGVPVGALIGALTNGDFRWKLPPGWTLVKIFGAGSSWARRRWSPTAATSQGSPTRRRSARAASSPSRRWAPAPGSRSGRSTSAKLAGRREGSAARRRPKSGREA